MRRLISDYVTPPKNAYKLNMALWWMDRFQKEIREKVRIRNIHDLFKVLEVENIMLCARLSATASLERKESRWGFWHYRAGLSPKGRRAMAQAHHAEEGRGPGGDPGLPSTRWPRCSEGGIMDINMLTSLNDNIRIDETSATPAAGAWKSAFWTTCACSSLPAARPAPWG